MLYENFINSTNTTNKQNQTDKDQIVYFFYLYSYSKLLYIGFIWIGQYGFGTFIFI
jgi:hypothetical protein